MNVHFTCNNGLGDKLLDAIGFYVICKFLNYNANINLNYHIENYQWGSNFYDPKLFIFNDIILTGNPSNYYIHSPHASSSLCPYKVYEFLKQILPKITFKQVSDLFKLSAKKIIQPSDIIASKIPSGAENAYGIHLRKSDKVNNEGDSRHENSIDEFNIITKKLLLNIEEIILNEDEPKFIVVSEDNNWKIEITNKINTIALNHNKCIKILEIDYTNENNYQNFNSVLDMFCLSKCKTILQGVKYSTFSMLSAILGNYKLINYSYHLPNDNICLVYYWNSVLEINNNLNYDIEFHKKLTSSVINIQTDIRSINTIKVKFFSDYCSSEHCKENYERLCEVHLMDNYGIDKDIYITNDNDYTHAVFLNAPIIYLNIPPQNVIGLAHEPKEFLWLRDEFKQIAQTSIGQYFIGKTDDLLLPFKSHYSYMFHNTPLQHIPIKTNKISIIFSQNTDAPGHKYRHDLVKEILKTQLPIDIYGRGCVNYSHYNDSRIKGGFSADNLVPYESYEYHIAIENFQSETYMSEKIINALLCNCIPIYLGAQQYNHIFPDTIIPLSNKLDEDMILLEDICNNSHKYVRTIDVENIKQKINLISNLPRLFLGVSGVI